MAVAQADLAQYANPRTATRAGRPGGIFCLCSEVAYWESPAFDSAQKGFSLASSAEKLEGSITRLQDGRRSPLHTAGGSVRADAPVAIQENDMRMLAGFAAIMLLSACTDRELIIESNTSWSGFIGGEESGYSRNGSGNATFDLDEGRTCWEFQKETAEGSIRAYAKTRELFGSDRSGDAWTTTEFGFVAGCIE
jgi:hypothetical protein